MKLNNSNTSPEERILDKYVVGPYTITISSTTNDTYSSFNTYEVVSIVENDPSLKGVVYLTTQYLKSVSYTHLTLPTN